jgi:uncharacterized protein (DUF362 family)
MSIVSKVRFTDYKTSVFKALDLVKAHEILPPVRTFLLKPNLIHTSPPPVTTPVKAAEAVYLYCKEHTNAEIILGEGCGSGKTIDTFRSNQYIAFMKKYNLTFVDFNTAPSTMISRDDTFCLKEFHLPEIARDAFIISIPVLKDHTMATTTLAMKNMFGLAPATFYSGGWNKSKLHSPSTHKSVVDICLYKTPGLCLIDGVTALTGSHLHGTEKHVGLILASTDCVAVDAVGSSLLGHDPETLEYLTLAHSRIGDMKNIKVEEG